jgi:hypothetical protein
MAIPGQASGDFRESAGALRILHVGVRNSVGLLTADAFTQTNPPIVTVPASVSTTLASPAKNGVLGGSVAFARPDDGNGFIGGPLEVGPNVAQIRALGLFINDAAGNDYENLPGVASNRGPYVSGQGTYGSQLYETQHLGTNADLTYIVGERLFGSRNGYLTNQTGAANTSEETNGVVGGPTLLGILKIVPDAALAEMVFDLRV